MLEKVLSTEIVNNLPQEVKIELISVGVGSCEVKVKGWFDMNLWNIGIGTSNGTSNRY